MAVEEKTTKKTSYIVLRKIDSGVLKNIDSEIENIHESYEIVDNISAVTSRQAISDAVKNKKLEFGTFVAVPARSFQKTIVRSEQVSRIIFE